CEAACAARADAFRELPMAGDGAAYDERMRMRSPNDARVMRLALLSALLASSACTAQPDCRELDEACSEIRGGEQLVPPDPQLMFAAVHGATAVDADERPGAWLESSGLSVEPAVLEELAAAVTLQTWPERDDVAFELSRPPILFPGSGVRLDPKEPLARG